MNTSLHVTNSLLAFGNMQFRYTDINLSLKRPSSYFTAGIGFKKRTGGGPSLLGDVMHHRFVVDYWCFRTKGQTLLTWGILRGCLTFNMRLICCPEMSTTTYQFERSNTQDEQRPQLHCRRCLKSHKYVGHWSHGHVRYITGELMCRYRCNKSTTDNFSITKCTAIKHNNFFLLVSIMLHFHKNGILKQVQSKSLLIQSISVY